MSSTSTALGHHRLTLENIPLREGTSATWGDSVVSWEDYLAEKSDQSLVFLGDGPDNYNDIMTAPYSHRFQQEYTEMQYAKMQDFIRGSLAEYDDPHLVFLTFSSSTTTATGGPRPPLDHMDEVVDAWGEGVYYELNRVMAGDRQRDPWESREWEYLYILEPTTDEGMVPGGYAHAHAALVVDGEVEAERFESVISRHLQECEGAEGAAHEFDNVIEVKRAENLRNPGAYLFKYLGKSWDMEAMEAYEKRFAALLKEEGRQRFRASNGAQRWMQRGEDSESGEWIFAGIADAESAKELEKFEDYEDFRLRTDAGGLRSWLARRRSSVLDADPVQEWEEEQKVKMTEEEFAARQRAEVPMPWEGDRPPPGVGQSSSSM